MEILCGSSSRKLKEYNFTTFKRYNKLKSSLAIRGELLDASINSTTTRRLSSHGRSLDDLMDRICSITDRLERLSIRTDRNSTLGLQEQLIVSLGNKMQPNILGSLSVPGYRM